STDGHHAVVATPRPPPSARWPSNSQLALPSDTVVGNTWVLGGHLVRVWGVVLALAATALAATVESVPSQGWLYLYLLILAVAWLASASSRRDIAVRGAG